MTDQVSQPDHKPGDIANGHVLGDDGRWHPITAPQAGKAKKPIYKRWWFIGGAGLAAIIIIGSIASGGSTDTAAAPTQDAPAAEEATVAGLNEPVRDGKFEFVVTGVETGVPSVGNEFLNETAQGSYTLVTLQVTNIGDVPQTFFDDNVEGFDTQDRQLSSDSSAAIYIDNNEGFLTEINPGNTVSAIVVFDVAAGESLSYIEVHDSAFSNGARINLQ